MAISMIGPKFYAWDDDGKPLSGGRVYTYRAGTNAPKATWMDEDQITENTNPVILNDAGYADIYLDGSYKIRVTDSTGTEIWTEDPVTDPGRLWSEWGSEYPATQYSPTQLEVPGDVRADFIVGHRLRLNDATTLYGTVTDAQYIGENTRVTVDVDGGSSLTGLLETAELAIIRANSLPVSGKVTFDTLALALAATWLKVGMTVETLGYNSAGDGGGNQYKVVPAASGTDDGGSYLDQMASGVQLEAAFPGGEARIEQFGCARDDLGTDSADALEAAFAYAFSGGLKLAGGGGEIYCARPVVVYPASMVVGATVDIATTLVFPNNGDGFTIGNLRESQLRFAGVRTLSGDSAATAGDGFTKDTMQNCRLTVDRIFGFKNGFVNTSQAADYYNRIDLGYIVANITSGWCVYIDTNYYSNENELTTRFMKGWKGIGSRDLTGQTFDEYNGWKFVNCGFENITHTAFEPKSFNRCAMLYPRLEGGDKPSDWWFNEDATNTSTTYFMSHHTEHSLLNLQCALTLWIGVVRDDNGAVLYDKMHRRDGESVYEGVQKVVNTLANTHLLESNLNADMGLWERWAGYVVDANGDMRRYGLLDPYGIQDLGPVSGSQDVDDYASHIKVSTTAGAPLTLNMPLRKEFEGYTCELEVSYYTDTISIRKSTGAETIAAGEITGPGLYRLLYRGGSWTWTRIGEKYT